MISTLPVELQLEVFNHLDEVHDRPTLRNISLVCWPLRRIVLSRLFWKVTALINPDGTIESQKLASPLGKHMSWILSKARVLGVSYQFQWECDSKIPGCLTITSRACPIESRSAAIVRETVSHESGRASTTTSHRQVATSQTSPGSIAVASEGNLLELMAMMPNLNRLSTSFPSTQALFDSIYQRCVNHTKDWHGHLSIHGHGLSTATCSLSSSTESKPFFTIHLTPQTSSLANKFTTLFKFKSINSLTLSNILSDATIGLAAQFETDFTHLVFKDRRSLRRLTLDISVGNEQVSLGSTAMKLAFHVERYELYKHAWMSSENRFDVCFLQTLFNVFGPDYVSEDHFSGAMHLFNSRVLRLTELTLRYQINLGLSNEEHMRRGFIFPARRGIQGWWIRRLLDKRCLQRVRVEVSYYSVPPAFNNTSTAPSSGPLWLWLGIKPLWLPKLKQLEHAGDLAEFLLFLRTIFRERMHDSQPAATGNVAATTSYMSRLSFTPLGAQNPKGITQLRELCLSQIVDPERARLKLLSWPRALEIEGTMECVFFPMCGTAERLKHAKQYPHRYYGISRSEFKTMRRGEEGQWTFLRDLAYYHALEALRVGVCWCVEGRRILVNSLRQLPKLKTVTLDIRFPDPDASPTSASDSQLAIGSSASCKGKQPENVPSRSKDEDRDRVEASNLVTIPPLLAGDESIETFARRILSTSISGLERVTIVCHCGKAEDQDNGDGAVPKEFVFTP